MYCPKCGTNNQDNSAFCANCGAPLQAQPQQAQPNQYAQQAQQSVQQFRTADPKGWYNGHPMGWYKFLIYFALFASALMYVITAITTFTSLGTYDLFGINLGFYKVWSIIYAILQIGVAVFCILVRNKLAGLKADGPKFLLYLYCAEACLTVLNFIISMISLGEVFKYINMYMPGYTGGFIAGFIISLAISGVMIVLNKMYFDKRKDIFNR